LSPTHGGAELGREAKVAAAAVRAAHDGDDGGAATRAAENVVRGKELTRNGFAERARRPSNASARRSVSTPPPES
jgi:hypothetical protein